MKVFLGQQFSRGVGAATGSADKKAIFIAHEAAEQIGAHFPRRASSTSRDTASMPSLENL